jgi:hypothetical protein
LAVVESAGFESVSLPQNLHFRVRQDFIEKESKLVLASAVPLLRQRNYRRKTKVSREPLGIFATLLWKNATASQ